MNDRIARLAIFVLASGLLFVTPGVTFAQNCANRKVLTLGERAVYPIAAHTNLPLQASVAGGRSYYFVAWSVEPYPDGVNGGLYLSTDGNCKEMSDQGIQPVWEYAGAGPGTAGAAASLTPSASGTVYLFLENRTGANLTLRMLLIETTLFSPWWFTGGTNDAYIEIANGASFVNYQTEFNVPNASLYALFPVITVYGPDGEVCGATLFFMYSRGSTKAISLRSLCPFTTSGSVQIVFNGAPGAIVANLTTLDVVHGTSFDAPFKPRMEWGTFSGR